MRLTWAGVSAEKRAASAHGNPLERLAAHRQFHLGADVELAQQQVATDELFNLLEVALRREQLLAGAAEVMPKSGAQFLNAAARDGGVRCRARTSRRR